MLRKHTILSSVLILIIAIAIAGAVLLHKSNSKPENPESRAGKMALSSFDVPKLTPPSGWLHTENITDTYIGIVYRTPETAPTGEPKANIHIDVDYLPISDAGLQTYIDSIVEEKAKATRYYTNFSHKNITISGAKGVSLEFDYVSSKEGITHSKVLVVFKDGKRYVFDASTSKENWPEYSAPINAALNSIDLP